MKVYKRAFRYSGKEIEISTTDENLWTLETLIAQLKQWHREIRVDMDTAKNIEKAQKKANQN